MLEKQLLLVGASARAAAASAVAAGFEVAAIDLFGDQDLARIAEVVVCPADEYPQAIPALARQWPTAPCCYLGGLENRPDLISQLQTQRTVYGVAPAQLERCRNPFELADQLGQHGLMAARCARTAPSPAVTSRWLGKPFASCGGTGVRWADATTAPDVYWQEFIPGRVYGGSFVASSAGCDLLCVARQFTAQEVASARPSHPFAFAGAVGPVPLSASARRDWLTIGQTLVDVFGLRGVFGVDAIWNPDQGTLPIVLELNPRFTSSMELFDLSRAGCPEFTPAIGLHVAACTGQPVHVPGSRGTTHAKFVLYAPGEVFVDLDTLNRLQHTVPTAGQLADVPVTPQRIKADHPVCSVLLKGPSVEDLWAELGLAGHAGIVAELLATLNRVGNVR